MEQINDPLAERLPRDLQTRAAHLVQDAFTESFRLSFEAAPEARAGGIEALVGRLAEWTAALPGDAPTLATALLLWGLDQWGVAYSQVFGAGAMTGLSELVAGMRGRLGVADEAACHDCLQRLADEEAAAFAFKAELRKAIHLALWHAMVAEEDRDGAFDILRRLGGMMLGLVEAMPGLGWIIVAETLAAIQLRCLAHGLASEGIGLEATRALFAALARQLPEAERDRILSAADQAVLRWQQASRGVH